MNSFSSSLDLSLEVNKSAAEELFFILLTLIILMTKTAKNATALESLSEVIMNLRNSSQTK